MTIEEEIIIAARERADRHRIAEMELYGGDKCNYSYGRIYNSEISSFEAGAKYADENQPSPWISVEDDLPYNHEELILYDVYTKQVIVADHEGCIGIQRMKKSCNGIIGVEPCWQWEIPSVVYYWMPIPELPKYRKLNYE